MSQPFRLCFPMLPRCRPGNCDPKGRSYPYTPPLRRLRFSVFNVSQHSSRTFSLLLAAFISFPLYHSLLLCHGCQHRSNLPPYFSWFCPLLASSSLSTQRKPRPSLLPLLPSLSHRDITLQQFRLWFAGSIHWLFDSC